MRLTHLERWEKNTIDLTWYCVPCYRQLMQLASVDEAAIALDVYQNNDYRKLQTEKWLRKGGKNDNMNK